MPQQDPRAVLHDIFGFTAFRGRQEEIVRCVVAGGDELADFEAFFGIDETRTAWRGHGKAPGEW